MNPFGIGNALSLGARFAAARAAKQALLLIGLGILLPFALQYGAAQRFFGTMDPALMEPTALSDASGARGFAAVLAAIVAGYVVQAGSYFASWRLGFGRDGALLRATFHGLATGLLVFLLLALLAVLAVAAVRQAGSLESALFIGFIAIVPVLVALGMFFTMLTTLLLAAVILLFSASMIFGAATGNIGLAATMVGGSGGVVVALLLLSAVLMWVTARFSCTAALMADVPTYNLFRAARESWRLTWEEQWAILRYLALIGFGSALLLLVGMVALGAGTAMFLEGAGGAGMQAGVVIVRILFLIPLAYLTVIVPAGIYRELIRSDASAEVFA